MVLGHMSRTTSRLTSEGSCTAGILLLLFTRVFVEQLLFAMHCSLMQRVEMALVPSSWEDSYCTKHYALDAQGVLVHWWGKGTGVFGKREVPECRCSHEQSETGAQWSRGSGGKWRRRWLWSKVCRASQAVLSSWNFAPGTIEPLRDFKQGSNELRLTIQLNHFCFSVENRLERGKSGSGGVVSSLLHSSRGKTTLPWARVDSRKCYDWI